MNQRQRLGVSILAVLTLAALVSPRQLVAESGARADPIRRTLVFRGTEREYFVYLPAEFNRDTKYWPLVVVGGVSGRNFLSNGIAQRVTESGFDAIIISPSFPADDINAIRFPTLGEGEFLQDVLRDVRKAYPLQPKMLLTGYSRGGQFAHRFALTFPDQVRAVAPFASGSWTTPDGRFLVEELGEVRNPRTFLSNASNASAIPARLKDLFEPRVARVVDSKAAAGAQNVPFLVMCGTLDPRQPIAKEFVRSLDALRYQVEVEWPRTPHLCGDDESRTDCQAEFQKYSRGAAAFFQKIVEGRPR
jgi:pimeloyl-ACP methyl ester carboxylesterase